VVGFLFFENKTHIAKKATDKKS